MLETIREILEQFAGLDPTTRFLMMTIIAGGLVELWKAIGLKCRPGLETVVASVLTGAALGAASAFGEDAVTWTSLIVSAVFGAFSGLAATGGHQVLKQQQKYMADRGDIEQQKMLE